MARLSAQRERMLNESLWADGHEPSIHYAQIRPMPLRDFRAHTLPLTTDCSGYVTCLHFAAGAPDPNGMNYDGAGNTDSLLAHCTHIPRRDAQPGDLIHYGGPDFSHHHIVMLVARGARWIVDSHGQESGPRRLALADENAAHAGQPITYLRSPAPMFAPPRWTITNNGRLIIAKTDHPLRWLARHPRVFRNHKHPHFDRTD